MYFDKEIDLTVNTTSCQMRWSGNHEYDGTLQTWHFLVPGQAINVSYKVCKIEFASTILIGKEVRVKITGAYALSLVSTHGNIEIHSEIDISGSTFNQAGMQFNPETNVGGYVRIRKDELDAGMPQQRMSVIVQNLSFTIWHLGRSR